MAEDPSVPAGTNDARFALDQSRVALLELLSAFDGLARRIKDPDGESTLREIQTSLSRMGKIRARLADEVVKHEERALRSATRLADDPFDLDALRDSLGGKLDRFRAAGDAEGVSEEPDGR